MDVWFDSGSTHAAVLDERPYLQCPADLYLEGGDQYRGWFQSSMLTSIAAKGVAPYKQIITHGWTVDGEGKAMHKSLGNAVAPEEVIKDYGADMLRLWVASADYTQDMRISKDIMKQLSQAYLKIRNTARYMLGNLCDFDPDRDQVPAEHLMRAGPLRPAHASTSWPRPPAPPTTAMSSTPSTAPSTTSAWWICPTSIWTSSRTGSTAAPRPSAAPPRPPCTTSWTA